MLVRSPHVTPATAELHVVSSVTCVFLRVVGTQRGTSWRQRVLGEGRKMGREGGWKEGRQLTGPFRI